MTRGRRPGLFHRGHLIGYQFSGLTNEGRKIWFLNCLDQYEGIIKGQRNNNVEAYSTTRNGSVVGHPQWLDYKVTPVYTGDELIPRQVTLQYVGIDRVSNLLPINLSS